MFIARLANVRAMLKINFSLSRYSCVHRLEWYDGRMDFFVRVCGMSYYAAFTSTHRLMKLVALIAFQFESIKKQKLASCKWASKKFNLSCVTSGPERALSSLVNDWKSTQCHCCYNRHYKYEILLYFILY